MAKYVGAIDQGTSGTRFMIFGHDGQIVAVDRREHRQICPRPGWVEHDPAEIWRNTQLVIDGALAKAGLTKADLAAVGVTNQRETTILWDRHTGAPLHNAIVWMDTRTDELVSRFAAEGGKDRLRRKTGLPLATYFSGLKLAWLLERAPGAREKAEAGDALFGSMDSWVIWNLTGGPNGGVHLTDVTNASRTQLMNIETLEWDADILQLFGVPRAVLPRIVSSSEVYGRCASPLEGTPISGALGDQHGALLGQACLEPGEAKNTYGTGCFLLMNTGNEPRHSSKGLITTLAYQFGGARPVYALEGSIAIAGALAQWLRDNLGVIENIPDIEELAKSVPDSGDVYFVPAFSGLFAPHWDEKARGVIVGLTRFANKGHIARAALEATAFQTRELVEIMVDETGVELAELRVDGGMADNELLMQFQADILGAPVVRPKCIETTALGAAYAAGLAVGFWDSPGDLANTRTVEKRWLPQMSAGEREKRIAKWNKAVARSFDWKD